jgi:Glycosyl hydrolase family 79, N-terminal domain
LRLFGRTRVRRSLGTWSEARGSLCTLGCLISALLVAQAHGGTLTDAPSVTPSGLPRIGTVDERFQSYNIEMVEITGGRFWKSYRPQPDAQPAPSLRSGSDAPPDSNLFQYRPPIDLTQPRLRKLAAALAPAYLRVSGTWANSTYFSDSDDVSSAPPAGFNGVLSRQQWQSVVDFVQSVDARIVTSFAISAGTRDAAGKWKHDQADRLVRFTHSIGGKIAAAEFMNEPDLAAIGGAPAGYDPAAYGQDFKIFDVFLKQTSPKTMILGPGTIGETALASDLLVASGADLDVVSYHYYGALSERCNGNHTPDAALSEDWLRGTDRAQAFYRDLRDRFEPGKPIWLTETAEAACGGNPWASSFLDTFRYLDQLGRLAKAGVQVVMHNTLAASDYGLLDERTLEPRPNYWGALLWRQLMGTTVLDAGLPIQLGLHVYAHCQRDKSGAVTLLVINTDHDAPHALTLPTASVLYTLDAVNALDARVRVNGNTLALAADDKLPSIPGAPTPAGPLTFAQATITFVVIPEAGNDACR